MSLGTFHAFQPINRVPGSPWDEDKAMMSRWGLEGMRSFEQTGVAMKEGPRLEAVPDSPKSESTVAQAA